MRKFEFRDRDGDTKYPHELVTVTYESDDGMTRHSQVTELTDDDVWALAHVALGRINEKRLQPPWAAKAARNRAADEAERLRIETEEQWLLTETTEFSVSTCNGRE